MAERRMRITDSLIKNSLNVKKKRIETEKLFVIYIFD